MTLTLPIIYFNQALNLAPEASTLLCAREFLAYAVNYLESYLILLRSERSDKNHAGLPKYSTRREIGRALDWPGAHDDRGLLTLLLGPGELTLPRTLEQPDQEWHLNVSRLPEPARSHAERLAAEIVAELKRIHVFYYKPHAWLPALRVEIGHGVAQNRDRLASVVQGLKHQCVTPAMLEPYPLYLADRTVKALARSLPAFRQVTTQHVSESYDGDVAEVFFAMHGYRSETGG